MTETKAESDQDINSTGKSTSPSSPKMTNGYKRAGKFESEVLIEKSIGSLEDLNKSDQYYSNNRFLVEGYRLNHFTKEDCFRSLWSWHNETLNIWTHLLGSIMFIGMGIWFFINYNSCRDIYVRMIQDIKAANLSWDWDSMAKNMEVFKNQLTGSAPAQEVGIGQVMQSLTVDIDRALAKKMDVISFIAIFNGGNTLAQYTASYKDWMPTFSQYHKFVLGLNKKMDILDTQQMSPKLDFAKMEIFSKMGATLPRREVHTNLSIWPIILYFLCAL
jgi:hypothetical protein